MPADHYQESTYGDAIADTYDDLYGTFLADPVQIKVLADLAGDGPAVEIGSGTGRVALPLARVGVPVVGIDASGEMTRQLHRSAVAEGLAVTAVEADAAAFTVADPVPLVYAVFNTFFLLADRDVQARFLAQAAKALGDGGALVLETFVPRPGRLPDGPHPGVFPADSTVVVKQRGTERVVLFAATNTPPHAPSTTTRLCWPTVRRSGCTRSGCTRAGCSTCGPRRSTPWQQPRVSDSRTGGATGTPPPTTPTPPASTSRCTAAERRPPCSAASGASAAGCEGREVATDHREVEPSGV
ncbi:class I SAM-dependent methyltransferase [Frankia sp. CiP3]|uniref:class I SAM-dependent methyltransferase n=1 Tax=Frankia sp. CiP3 TaxID=2880971 RepID=UPI001EF656CE|nr:class I SAM-dependent methyltransferase [Frankia sp. CiP3]